MNIIDYSLLMGEIIEPSVEELRELTAEDPELARGIYITQDGKAYLLGIIDPLTNFGSLKCIEYRSKQLCSGHKMSCVPPNIYALRFQRFMREILLESGRKLDWS